MAIEPSVGLLISWTNDWHHFFERSATLVLSGQILIRVVAYGPWFWVNAVYSYLLFIISAILLIHTFLRAQRLYRRQILVLLLFVIIPWAGNGIYVSQLIFHWGNGPIPDITPFLFIVGGLLMLWGTLRYHLMDVVPIARDTIISNMRTGVMVLDTQGVVIDLNPLAERIVGYSESELVGKRAVQWLTLWPGLVRYLEQNSGGSGEQMMVFDGETHHFEWRLSPITEEHQTQVGWVLVFRDITGYKHAEAALIQTNKQLQSEIEQREQLIAEVDAFAHTVAHDLKNPLSIIIGYADVLHLDLREMGVAEKQQLYVEKVENTARKMGYVIDELLLLANVRQEDVEMSPLDTAFIITQAIRRLSMRVAEYHAEIIQPEAWHSAMGYAPWVEEIWENLLSNAIKYGGTPPVIKIGSKLENDMVWFWVADNGNGISPEWCATIFSKNQRKHKSRLGYGLGLSIVQRIVKKHGGSLKVENSPNPNEGCIFSFSLPAAHAATLPAAQLIASVKGAQ